MHKESKVSNDNKLSFQCNIGSKCVILLLTTQNPLLAFSHFRIMHAYKQESCKPNKPTEYLFCAIHFVTTGVVMEKRLKQELETSWQAQYSRVINTHGSVLCKHGSAFPDLSQGDSSEELTPFRCWNSKSMEIEMDGLQHCVHTYHPFHS